MCILIFTRERCVGCDACVAACLDEQDNLPVVKAPLRRVYRYEQARGGKGSLGLVLPWPACTVTTRRVCGRLSRRAALPRTPPRGPFSWTARAVSAAAPAPGRADLTASCLTTEKRPKCDGCLKRLRQGQLPRCVEACPRHAITIDDRPPVRGEGRKELLRVLKKKRLC